MKKVYEALQEVDTNYPSPAICLQVKRLTLNNPIWIVNRVQAFKAWPKFSGNKVFPVPYKVFGAVNNCPEEAYYTREKWTGRYGRDRRELLEHLIQYFKERDL